MPVKTRRNKRNVRLTKRLTKKGGMLSCFSGRCRRPTKPTKANRADIVKYVRDLGWEVDKDTLEATCNYKDKTDTLRIERVKANKGYMWKFPKYKCSDEEKSPGETNENSITSTHATSEKNNNNNNNKNNYGYPYLGAR
jgi:hypothetical protein